MATKKKKQRYIYTGNRDSVFTFNKLNADISDEDDPPKFEDWPQLVIIIEINNMNVYENDLANGHPMDFLFGVPHDYVVDDDQREFTCLATVWDDKGGFDEKNEEWEFQCYANGPFDVFDRKAGKKIKCVHVSVAG